MDLSLIKDHYKTAIVFDREDMASYLEFIDEVITQCPERFVNKSERFWKSDKILKSTNVNNARPAVALACDAASYSSDKINWCDEAWYRDNGFTIIECSDLLVDDFQLDVLEDLNILFFGE